MNNETKIDKSPLKEGTARFELLHQKADGRVVSYSCIEMPGFRHCPTEGNLDMPMIPFLGPVGGVLITIPTVGHAKFATDIGALTGWEMALGIGTGAELAADTTMSSEITTYGGARKSVTPTILTNVITWSTQWTFTTGASFSLTEAGVFKDTILMMRHKYSVAKPVVATDKVTAILTDTV